MNGDEVTRLLGRYRAERCAVRRLRLEGVIVGGLEGYLRTVLLKRFGKCDEELLQGARVGALKALRCFDPGRGPFWKILVLCVVREVDELDGGGAIRVPAWARKRLGGERATLELDEERVAVEDFAEGVCERLVARDWLGEILGRLERVDSQGVRWLKLYAEGFSMEGIGRLEGVSTSKVRLVIGKLRRKARGWMIK